MLSPSAATKTQVGEGENRLPITEGGNLRKSSAACGWLGGQSPCAPIILQSLWMALHFQQPVPLEGELHGHLSLRDQPGILTEKLAVLQCKKESSNYFLRT